MLEEYFEVDMSKNNLVKFQEDNMNQDSYEQVENYNYHKNMDTEIELEGNKLEVVFAVEKVVGMVRKYVLYNTIMFFPLNFELKTKLNGYVEY